MERRKFGEPTVIQNRVHRLSGGSDLRQIEVAIAGVVLAEVEAESALSFVKLSHAEAAALLGPHFETFQFLLSMDCGKPAAGFCCLTEASNTITAAGRINDADRGTFAGSRSHP